MDQKLDMLKAAGEETRLRLLALLRHGELSNGELALCLGQSQPRISRHLKLLHEAGLIARRPEGAWVFFNLSAEPSAQSLFQFCFDDAAINLNPILAQDLERLGLIKAQREAQAKIYFDAAAEEWETLKRLHQPDVQTEAQFLAWTKGRQFAHHLDLGTGTGRMLTLFAPQTSRRTGADGNGRMLAVARTNLATAGIDGQTYQADIGHLRGQLPANLPAPDLITIHQVLHFLDDPNQAIAEAAAILAPGGLLLIADLAPHQFEELRARHAHRFLGLDAEGLHIALSAHGLEPLFSDIIEHNGKKLKDATDGALRALVIMAQKNEGQQDESN